MPTEWQDYQGTPNSTVVGTLKVSTATYAPPGSKERQLLVYLPPSYGTSDKRYPVIYAQDGQNLFDEATSWSDEWRVDETMEALSAEGIEAIVVGIPNGDERRSWEYMQHVHPEIGGGGADEYIRFLTETIKPVIDASFRTIPDREHTGIMGASLGGLISIYGFITRPDVFGFAGVFSPAFWCSEDTYLSWLQPAPYIPGRIYMDVGTNESPEMPGIPAAYVRDANKTDEILRGKGYDAETLLFVLEENGPHHESAWARRLPDALRFLLGPISG